MAVSAVLSALRTFVLRFLESPIEAAGIFQILCIRMPFGNSSHKLEGAKGIVTLAAELTQYGTTFRPGDVLHSFRAGSLGSAVGVDKKYRFPLGQILACIFCDGFLKFEAIDPGGKTNAVIFVP